jgi:hypothetical protein
MAYNNPKRGKKMRALHHFEGFRASRETRLSGPTGETSEHAETDQTHEDQIDSDDEIEQPRHQQDQDTRDQGDDGGNVRSGDGHSNASGISGEKSNRGRQLTRWRGSGIGDACGANGFRFPEKLPVKIGRKIAGKPPERLPRKLPEIAAYAAALFRNNAARDELARIVRRLAGVLTLRRS